MGYQVYERGGRWCGYGVPALCDMPGCGESINRGLGYVCEDDDAECGDEGCGLFFCDWHQGVDHSEAVAKPDTAEWLRHITTDESWSAWRAEYPSQYAAALAVLDDGEPCPESGVSIDPSDGRMMIATLEGVLHVSPGDYVIRGVAGEFYPIKPDIFEATYEEVESNG